MRFRSYNLYVILNGNTFAVAIIQYLRAILEFIDSLSTIINTYHHTFQRNGEISIILLANSHTHRVSASQRLLYFSYKLKNDKRRRYIITGKRCSVVLIVAFLASSNPNHSGGKMVGNMVTRT